MKKCEVEKEGRVFWPCRGMSELFERPGPLFLSKSNTIELGQIQDLSRNEIHAKYCPFCGVKYGN